MIKTIGIEGLGCENCEKTVKASLEALDGVSTAEVSRESKNAVVTLVAEIPDAILRAAVEKDGFYTVTGIE